MFAIFLGIIGFFTSSSDVIDAQLVNAFSWMLTWFVLVGIVQFCIWLILTAITFFGISDFTETIIDSKLFIWIATVLGASFTCYIMLARTFILIFLTYFLKSNIATNIKIFTDLSQNEIFMIVVIILFSLYSKGFKPLIIKL